jgi:transposase-like protein
MTVSGMIIYFTTESRSAIISLGTHKPHVFFGLPESKSGFLSLSFCNNCFLIPEASFRMGTRSSADFARFEVFLAMTLPDINALYSTDAQCRELLKKLRWPLGAECLRCKSKKVYDLPTQKKSECAECGYQFTVTAQTIFNDTHLPLETWFMAVLLLVEARKGFSANQMKRTLGVSYKTAWYLCHRIRKAMASAHKPMLDGKVEIDETYVGGKFRSKPWNHKRYTADTKQVVIGIRQRNGDLRFIHAKDAKSKTVKEIVNNNVSADVDVLLTDESTIYQFMFNAEQKAKHQTINHSKEYVRGDIHTNTVESAFSLLKRGIVGTWHRVSAKHLMAYLEEMEFRFNRRNNPELFIDTLRHMITADPMTFENLTAEPEKEKVPA